MIIPRPICIDVVYFYFQHVSCIYNAYRRIIYYKTPAYVMYHFISSLLLSLNLSDLQNEVEPCWELELSGETGGVRASQ